MAAEDEEKAGPRARSDGFSEERRRLFLAALRTGESVLGACALVGLSNRTAYNYRDRDPAFAREWELARQMSRMPLELMAYERGVLGTQEPVYAYGKLSHVRVSRSDRLLVKLLEGEQPGKYGRRAGLKADRKWLEKRLEKQLAAEIAPLREALRAARAELDALQTGRNSGGGAVNFVKAGSGAESAAPAPARRERRGATWRLAAAERRWRKAEVSPLPRSS